MKINFLKIKAFGKLKDLEIDFSPKLNFIYGPNEAGKSTLQKCFLGLLYGFKKPEKKKSIDEPEQDLFLPWDDDRYTAGLQYELDNQSQFEVHRDFKREAVEIRNAKTGEDITSNFSEDKTKEKLFAAEHLGLPKEAFVSTVFVKQAQVKELEEPSALAHKVQSLADTGTETISAVQAIKRLEGALGKLGVRQESQKEFGRIAKKRNDLIEEQKILSKIQQEQLEDLHKLRQLKTDLELLKAQKVKLEFFKLKSEQNSLIKKLKDLEILEEKIQETKKRLKDFEKYKSFSMDTYNQIIQRKTKLDETINFLNNLKNKKESLNQQIIQIQSKLNEDFLNWSSLREDPETVTAQYEIFIKIKQADLKQVEEKLNSLTRQEEVLKKQLDYYEELFVDILGAEDLENKIADLEKSLRLSETIDFKEKDKQRITTSLLESRKNYTSIFKFNISLIILFVIGLAGAFIFDKFNIIAPLLIFLILTSLGATYFQFNIRNKVQLYEAELIRVNQDIKQIEEAERDAQERVKKLLSKAQAANFAQLRSRQNEYFKIKENLNSLYGQKQALAQELTDLRNLISQKTETFKSFMAECNFSAEEITPPVIEEFKSLIKEYQALKKDWQKLTDETQKTSLDLETYQDKKKTYQGELEILLGKQNIKSLDQQEEYLKSYKTYEELSNSLKSLENERNVKLDNKDANFWSGKKDKISKQLEALVTPSDFKATEIKPDLIDSYSQELEKIKLESSNLGVTIGQLEGKLSSHKTKSLADVEEELELVQNRFNQLVDYQESLRKAKEILSYISQKYHEDILAPELNDRLSQLIFEITEKYNQVKVDYKQEKADAGFNINVTIPSLDITKEAGSLSLGTQEQLYLALKICMAQILSQKGEKLPLFLDDVFSNFDVLRRKKAFEFLLSLSKAHQIFFFTSDINQYYQIKEILQKKAFSCKEKKFDEMILLYLD